MTEDRILPVPRQVWHHPDDRWQVLFADDCSFLFLAYPDPRPVRLNGGTGDWEWGYRSGRHTDGPRLSYPVSKGESYASLRRIVPRSEMTRAELTRFHEDFPSEFARAAQLDSARKSLPRGAVAFVDYMDSDPNAFGCRHDAVIEVIAAYLSIPVKKLHRASPRRTITES